MTDRTVTAVYNAKVDNYLSGVSQMREENRKFRDDLTKSATQNKADWDKIGGTALKAGAAGAAGLALVSKAAVDWETAWAGVKKTVDGTDAQMTELEGSLRGLAKTLPATHADIAAVAEAAGQLGVKREDVTAFTKTMIDLGESTNLTADEAATSIAQISNVMGTMDREGTKGVERFGSALVDLGNKGASTEKDILAMSTRIAGAAKVVGMTEADLLGMSNALASVGIEAEAGGSAVSKVLTDMSKAVAQGSEKLEGFAKVAGMSTDAFADLFKKAPADAMAAFTKGLDNIRKSGGDVFTTLDDLDLKEIRTTTALLKMAGASDMVAQSLQDGRDAWAKNNALTDEAAKRYETTASQLAIARNNVKDAAIDFGTVLLPAIQSASEGIRDFAAFMADLPGPVKETGVYLAAAGSAVLLLGGGAIKATTSILEMKAAMVAAEVPATGLTNALKGAAAAGAVFAAASIAVTIRQSMGEAQVATVKIDDLAASLERTAKGGRQVEGALADMFAQQGGLLVAKEQFVSLDEVVTRFQGNATNALVGFGRALNDWNAMDKWLGRMTDGGEGAARFEKQVKQLDGALAQMVNEGNADQASVMFDKLFKGMDPTVVDEAKRKFELYNTALADNAVQAGAAGAAAVDGATGVTGIGEAAGYSAEEIDNLTSSMESFGSQVLSQRDAMRGMEAAIDSATEAVKKNGATLDIGTEAGRANEAALDAIASSSIKAAAQTFKLTQDTEAAAATLKRGRDAFIEAAVAAGRNADQANRLADELGLIPGNVKTVIDVNSQQALGAIATVRDRLANLTDRQLFVRVNYTTSNAPGGGRSTAGGQWANGGYTGPGGKYEPAGIVHKGEFVHRQEITGAWRPLFEHMHRGGDPRAFFGLRGYAGGGYVDARPAMTSSRSSSFTFAPQINGALDTLGVARQIEGLLTSLRSTKGPLDFQGAS